MKSLVVELFHHHEVIPRTVDFYQKRGYEVKVVLGSFVYERSKTDAKCIVLPQPNRKQYTSLNTWKKPIYALREFIETTKNVRELEKIILREKPKIVHINTVETPFAIPLLLMLLRLKTITFNLTIHSTNRLRVDFKKYMWFDFLIKKSIESASQVFLLGPYLKFDAPQIQEKTVYLIEKRTIKKKSLHGKIVFILTGNLNRKEKDITLVLQAFSSLIKEHPELKKEVRLEILTKIDSQTENEVEELGIQDITITHKSFVDQRVFDKSLRTADYLILSTKQGSIYGSYKISGSHTDALAHGIPIIASKGYAAQYKGEEIVHRFDKDDLVEVLRSVSIKDR